MNNNSASRMTRQAAIKAAKPVGKTPKLPRQTAKSANNILGNLKRKSAKKTQVGF